MLGRLLFVLGDDRLHGKSAELAHQPVRARAIRAHRRRQHQVPDPFRVFLERPTLALRFDFDPPDLVGIQGDRALVPQIEEALFERRLQVTGDGHEARIAGHLGIEPVAGGSLVAEQQRQLLRLRIGRDFQALRRGIKPEVFQACRMRVHDVLDRRRCQSVQEARHRGRVCGKRTWRGFRGFFEHPLSAFPTAGDGISIARLQREGLNVGRVERDNLFFGLRLGFGRFAAFPFVPVGRGTPQCAQHRQSHQRIEILPLHHRKMRAGRPRSKQYIRFISAATRR